MKPDFYVIVTLNDRYDKKLSRQYDTGFCMTAPISETVQMG